MDHIGSCCRMHLDPRLGFGHPGTFLARNPESSHGLTYSPNFFQSWHPTFSKPISVRGDEGRGIAEKLLSLPYAWLPLSWPSQFKPGGGGCLSVCILELGNPWNLILVFPDFFRPKGRHLISNSSSCPPTSCQNGLHF